MNLSRDTKTFTVTDYRDSEVPNGVHITGGNGDGLYDMDLVELKELRDLVCDLISDIEICEKCQLGIDGVCKPA